jgi:hypothetical protein
MIPALPLRPDCPPEDVLDESHGGSTMPDGVGPSGPTPPDPASPPTPGPTPPGGSAGAPPGLRAELGATRGAAMRLVQAHIALARAEFTEILGEIKRFAIAAGIAFALLLFAGLLIPIGTTLFLGEWLFGSLGWGVLIGAEFAAAVAIVAILAVIGATRVQVGRTFLVALIVGVVVGVVLGLDLTNQGWSRVGDSIFGTVDAGYRPLVTAVAVLALIIAVVGLLAGLRAGGIAGGIGGLIGGAILGAILGGFTALRWGPHAGAGAGFAVGSIVWPALLVSSVLRRGIDFEALKNKLWPNETIETTRETIEWVRKQTPLGRKS